MKKFLGFIALIILVALPVKINAATWGLSAKADGKPDANGYFTVSVKLVQSDGNTVSEPLSTTMELTNVTVEGEPVAADGWAVIRDGNNLTFTPSAPVTAAESTIATIKFKKVAIAEKCKVTFNCQGTPVPVDPEPENPKTGSALPYVVLISGAVLAVGVYYITRRNTKFYRI